MVVSFKLFLKFVGDCIQGFIASWWNCRRNGNYVYYWDIIIRLTGRAWSVHGGMVDERMENVSLCRRKSLLHGGPDLGAENVGQKRESAVVGDGTLEPACGYMDEAHDYQWFADYGCQPAIGRPMRTSILASLSSCKESDPDDVYDNLSRNLDVNLAYIDMDNFCKEDMQSFLSTLPQMCSAELQDEGGEMFASVSGSLMVKYDLDSSLSPRSSSQMESSASSLSFSKSEIMFSPVKETPAMPGVIFSTDSLDCGQLLHEQVFLTCHPNKDNYTIAFEGSTSSLVESVRPSVPCISINNHSTSDNADRVSSNAGTSEASVETSEPNTQVAANNATSEATTISSDLIRSESTFTTWSKLKGETKRSERAASATSSGLENNNKNNCKAQSLPNLKPNVKITRVETDFAKPVKLFNVKNLECRRRIHKTVFGNGAANFNLISKFVNQKQNIYKLSDSFLMRSKYDYGNLEMSKKNARDRSLYSSHRYSKKESDAQLQKNKDNNGSSSPVYVMYPNYTLPDLEFLKYTPEQLDLNKVFLMPQKFSPSTPTSAEKITPQKSETKDLEKRPCSCPDVESLKNNSFKHIQDWESLLFLLPKEYSKYLMSKPELEEFMRGIDAQVDGMELLCSSGVRNSTTPHSKTPPSSSSSTTGYRGSSSMLSNEWSPPPSKHYEIAKEVKGKQVCDSEKATQLPPQLCAAKPPIRRSILRNQNVANANAANRSNRECGGAKRYSMFELGTETDARLISEKRSSLPSELKKQTSAPTRMADCYSEDEGVESSSSHCDSPGPEGIKLEGLLRSSQESCNCEFGKYSAIQQEIERCLSFAKKSVRSVSFVDITPPNTPTTSGSIQRPYQMKLQPAFDKAIKEEGCDSSKPSICDCCSNECSRRSSVCERSNECSRPSSVCECSNECSRPSSVCERSNECSRPSSVCERSNERSRLSSVCERSNECSKQNVCAHSNDSPKKSICDHSSGSCENSIHYKIGLVESLTESARSLERDQSAKNALNGLCPHLYALLNHGLKSCISTSFGDVNNSVWQLVESSAQQGPMTNALYELVLKINNEEVLTEGLMKFNSFIFGLLNVGGLDTWFTYLRTRESLLRKHYEINSLLLNASRGSIHDRQLSDKILEALKPLARVRFQLDLLYECRQIHDSLMKLAVKPLVSPLRAGQQDRTTWVLKKIARSLQSLTQCEGEGQLATEVRPRSCVDGSAGRSPEDVASTCKRRWSGIQLGSMLVNAFDQLASQPDNLDSLQSTENEKRNTIGVPPIEESEHLADTYDVEACNMEMNRSRKFKSLQKKWERISEHSGRVAKPGNSGSFLSPKSKIPRPLSSPNRPLPPTAFRKSPSSPQTIIPMSMSKKTTCGATFNSTSKLSPVEHVDRPSTFSRIPSAVSTNLKRPTSLPQKFISSTASSTSRERTSSPCKTVSMIPCSKNRSQLPTLMHRRVRTLCHRLPSDSGHLSFNEGENLKVILEVDDKWILCCRNRQKGLVPRSAVIPLVAR